MVAIVGNGYSYPTSNRGRVCFNSHKAIRIGK